MNLVIIGTCGSNNFNREEIYMKITCIQIAVNTVIFQLAGLNLEQVHITTVI